MNDKFLTPLEKNLSQKIGVSYYDLNPMSKPIVFDMENSLRKFLEFIGSENISSFFDFSEEIKGGEGYVSINIEFLNQQEILLNNSVVSMGEKNFEKLSEAVDRATCISYDNDKNEDEVFGVIYMVENENKLQFLVKFDKEDINKSEE